MKKFFKWYFNFTNHMENETKAFKIYACIIMAVCISLSLIIALKLFDIVLFKNNLDAYLLGLIGILDVAITTIYYFKVVKKRDNN